MSFSTLGIPSVLVSLCSRVFQLVSKSAAAGHEDTKPFRLPEPESLIRMWQSSCRHITTSLIESLKISATRKQETARPVQYSAVPTVSPYSRTSPMTAFSASTKYRDADVHALDFITP